MKPFSRSDNFGLIERVSSLAGGQIFSTLMHINDMADCAVAKSC